MNTSSGRQIRRKIILPTAIVALVGFLIVVIVLLCRTTHPGTPEQDSETTAWLKLPTVEQVVDWQWNEVDPTNVWRVSQAVLTQAVEQLANRPIVKLDEDDFLRYTGEKFRQGEQRQPYLVRGVFLKDSAGRFTVRHRDDVLWVRYGTLGRGKLHLVKMALVVILSREPTSVLVDGEIAE
jgi:hypothetical protein